MTEVTGRAYGKTAKRIHLCEHIVVLLDEQEDSLAVEYTEVVLLFCNVCKASHRVTILVN